MSPFPSRNTSTALILNRFSPRLIRLRRRLMRTMSDTEPTKTGARYWDHEWVTPYQQCFAFLLDYRPHSDIEAT